MKIQVVFNNGFMASYLCDHFSVGYEGTLLVYGYDGNLVYALSKDEWRACRKDDFEGCE